MAAAFQASPRACAACHTAAHVAEPPRSRRNAAHARCLGVSVERGGGSSSASARRSHRGRAHDAPR
jgi:hypothetical protein